ncbi:OmpA family protein [Saccharicrinis sp. FJH2]|uniref:OmpA family protein n=1 Tax=Saccharicrinis sp. FJH65 TaxID=3344659 RepID=UPI0035F2E48F
MRSKHYLSLLLFTLFFSGFVYAGEDVKIVLNDFISKDADTLGTRELVKAGDRLYKKGVEHYGEALEFFKGALVANSNYAPLNYKIGVCYLYTNNKRPALSYLLKCEPDISPEYYFVLGRAYHFNLMFDKAQQCYYSYYDGLKPKKQQELSKKIAKLTSECKNGKALIADSAWVDVHPFYALNSKRDEFQPFFAYTDSVFFFSSNRNSKNKINEDFFYVDRSALKLGEDTVLVLGEPGHGVNSKVNNAALCYNPSMDILLTYNGKAGKGDLFYMEKNKKGKFKQPKPLKGEINTKYQEGTAMFLDLKTLVLSSNRKGGEGGMDLYITHLNEDSKWSVPQNLGPYINTPYDEEVSGVSIDGRTLYFTTQGHNSMGGNDIFSTTLTREGVWTTPENLGYPINTPDNDVGYLEIDTNKVIVVGTRPEGVGGLDMFQLTYKYPVTLDDDHFSIKGKVTDSENNEPVDSAHVIIYNVFNDSVLAELTTDKEGFFYKWFPDKENVGFKVDADGYKPYMEVFKEEIGSDTLYFASVEMVPEEVEKVITYDFTLLGQVKDKQTNKPLIAIIEIYNDADSLIDKVTTDETYGRYKTELSDIRRSYYFKVSANDYISEDELHVFNAADSVRTAVQNFTLMPQPKQESLMFAGTVTDSNTGEPIVAEMKFIDPVSQQESIIYPDSVTGRYNYMLQAHHSMVVELRKDGYFFTFEMVPAPQNKEEKLVRKDFQLKPIKKGEKIVLNNILFETGKAVLTKDSYAELDKLVKVMLNSKVNVEISGHTDNTGGYDLNKKLSLARAKAVVDYLISSGIEASRLKYAGYGPDQPIATNTTREGRAQNRRVEMKIID